MGRGQAAGYAAIAVLVWGCSSSGGVATSSDSGSGSGAPCQKSVYNCGCGNPAPVSGGTASECSAADFAGAPGACCNWGGAELQCECAGYVCWTDGTVCRCDWGPANDTTTHLPAGATSVVSTCPQTDGMFCCQDTAALLDEANGRSIEGACICSTFSCDAMDVQVDHCGTDNPPPACPSAAAPANSCP
jgi:hypothetical protein